MDRIESTWRGLPFPAKAAAAAAAYYSLRELHGLITQKSLEGEVAVITGAGSGIGRLLAIKLATEHGVTVAVWDLNGKAAAQVTAEIIAQGGKAKAWTCDVTAKSDVYRLAKEVAAELGPVTILVNNAGMVTGKKLLESPDHLIEKTFAVNAISHVWMLKAFLPAMIEANHGHVISVASQAGQIGVAGLVDYCGSKFAAVGIDESLRMELVKLGCSGVKTTCVCPYFINTGMFDGVQTKFPWNQLLYIMEPEYVVNRMITAVRRDQKTLMLPPATQLATVARGLLPTSVFDGAMDLIGINASMDSFKGNSKSVDRDQL